jgi:hypothetical protein
LDDEVAEEDDEDEDDEEEDEEDEGKSSCSRKFAASVLVSAAGFVLPRGVGLLKVCVVNPMLLLPFSSSSSSSSSPSRSCS